MKALPSLALLAWTLAGCAGRGALAGEPRPETAPTPYTADEIRAALPPGSRIVLRREMQGLPTVHSTMTFRAADDPERETRLVVHTTTPDGMEVAPPDEGTVSWEELRDHAAFPAAATERAEGRIEVPAGGFDCMLYTVRTMEQGAPTVSRYWFAKDLPGPPVLLEVEREGTTILRLTLLETTRG